MNQNIYHSAIVLHIVGISFLAGSTVVDFLGYRRFWRAIETDTTRASIILESNAVFQRLMGLGMGLIVLSGVAMMYYTHGAWGEQLWFRIKFVLLLVVIINGLGVRRWLGSKLIKRLQETAFNTVGLEELKRNLSMVHGLQFLLLFSIFVLSVFKFN